MLYYITYSCGCGENEMVISADDLDAAIDYAYLCAKEEYESYEGSHGIRGLNEILIEEFGKYPDDDDIEDYYEDAEAIYSDEVESTVSFSAKKYDSEKHKDVLNINQNGKVYKI